MMLIMDIAVVALRMLLPLYTVVIVYQIFAAMRRRRRPERPLVLLQDLDTGEKTPVLFWENSIGRARSCDIALDDPAVSRNHCVLLRRKEGWFITDTGSKTGTYVNGKRIGTRRTMLNIDDTIIMGNREYVFRRGEEYHEELQSSWFFSKVSNKPAIQPYKVLILVSLFHVFMAVEACFCDGSKDFTPAVLCGFLIGVEWLFFVVSRFILKRAAFELEALGLFFTGIGVMLLARQNLQSAYTQLIAAVAGMIVFCILIKFIENPDRIGQWRLIIMIAAVLLLGVNLVFGRVTNGSANWVHLGPVSVQPSEFVKIAFIFVGASTLDRLQTRQNLLEFIVFSAICVGALALMGDFGTALIFFGTFLLISFTRSGDFKTVILALTGAGLGGFIVLNLKPYVLRRFQGWRHVWQYTQDSRGYQQARVLTYIASGGLFGVGIGNGVLKYVAASESDLVFGLMSEEMGFISAVTIAIAIATLFIYARSVTTRSRSTFYSISACCAAGLFVIQLSLNIFGATDILPLTGVTFPFISAGGSSIISCWGLLAFIKAADERTYSK